MSGGCCFNLKLYNLVPVVMRNLIERSMNLFIYLFEHCANFEEIAL